MKWFPSLLAWQVTLCVLGAGVCLIPTAPKTGAFWGELCAWAGAQPDRIYVRAVEPGSPADAAGLRNQDSVVAIAGEPIHSKEQFDAALRGLRPGSEVRLTVERDGRRLDLLAQGREPEVEAVYYYRGQLVCLAVLLVLASFLLAAGPRQPAPLWRPLVTLPIGLVGTLLLAASLVWPLRLGYGVLSTHRAGGQRWLIDNDPDWPRLAIQWACFAVAAGVLPLAIAEGRGAFRRLAARRLATEDLRGA